VDNYKRVQKPEWKALRRLVETGVLVMTKNEGLVLASGGTR
jgi:hypothetical protein